MPGEYAPRLALRQHRNEVCTRAADALLDQWRRVVDDPPDRLDQRTETVGLAPVDVEDPVGKGAQVIPVAVWHAHHLRDDAHRKGRGEFGQHVHRPVGTDPIEELGHRGTHERAPPLHRLRGEIPVHDAPHREVLGAVLLHQLVRAEVPDLVEERQVLGG